MNVRPARPESGQLARVRSRQYLVESVEDPVNEDDSALVRLSCLEDDAQGDQLEVLWNCEVDAMVASNSSWEILAQRGFDQPELFSAYLHTLRWNCVTATNPELFQAPLRAGIKIHVYQLEPLRKALLMPRVNLFIADDVGVGKTIEAGLVLRELILRQKVRRVVIACPPSVVRQWHDEMESRFGLQFILLDREYFIRCRQERGYGTNPWATHSRFIVSHALLRDAVYADPLRAWLKDFCPGSMLILDEAHNAAPSSGTRYAIDSHLTDAVRDLAPRFEHRLFLSATPHNGHSNSFSALLEILDPQRFCRGVPVSPALRDEVMVRRLKCDIRALGDSNEFPERKVIPVVIDGLPADAPELRLSRLLQEYRRLREQRLKGVSASRQATAMLVIINLQKRLLSSIEAFAKTLAVHKLAVEKARKKGTTSKAPAQKARRLELDDNGQASQSLLFQSPGADDDRAELDEAELAAEEHAELEAATAVGEEGLEAADAVTLEREQALLEEMSQIAERSRHRRDGRLERFLTWVRTGTTDARGPAGTGTGETPMCPDLGKPGATFSGRRVILFTEYADTKRYLEEQLQEALKGADRAEERVAVFHGGMGDAKRDAVAAAFNTDPACHPVRILIATDAAREGLNLQNHCADLFHFDVPWNPSRMEQRNGRIDRKLQKSPVVRCHYFLLPQRAEDRVLETLVHKTATIYQELGSLSPAIERRLNQLLLRGIPLELAQRLVGQIQEVDKEPPDGPARRKSKKKVTDEELETTRKRHGALQKELDTLRKMLTSAKEWLHFDEGHFRAALSASLSLLGANPLKQTVMDSQGKTEWVLPDLEQRFTGDPGWAYTLDSLRKPRAPDQKVWEWRRECRILPFIFEDSGEVGGDKIHLHLEHRLVQRLLTRFLAQGFLYDELTRAVVCLTDHAEPRVLALGRLSLYGPHASRLHDELITVSAAWTAPELRGRKSLSALKSTGHRETLELLERSLLEPRLRQVPEGRRSLLKDSAQRDVAELLPHLEERARKATEEARATLTARGEAEAAAMVKILLEQKARIEARKQELESPQKARTEEQLEMYPIEEQKQLEADRRYWPDRLKAIEQEMKDEPERIKAHYEVKAVRLEPAGLVYLWPVTG